ncbi:MAG: carboxypeptidase regulatory-like domain-containing protein [Candidatus Sericytochromatia bacterium]|nr:carboxypeptidase regulatory-like domain-containing protein [Candidatus Tanganyikabacteria bacterium]
MRRAWGALVLALALTGCPWFDTPVAGGSVEGKVQFGGRPAPGKVVTLLVAQGGSFVTAQPATASTNVLGDYRFTGLKAGAYKVTYVSQAVPDGNNVKRDPNEIGIWRTKARDVSSSAGVRMPPFDVAYNGLIYPATGIAYVAGKGLPLPFHWSTHLQAQKYQLIIYANDLGKEPSHFKSRWESHPTALYEDDVRTGKYSWEVVIDAGEAGEGRSLVRRLDMGPPSANPGTGEPGIPTP